MGKATARRLAMQPTHLGIGQRAITENVEIDGGAFEACHEFGGIDYLDRINLRGVPFACV